MKYISTRIASFVLAFGIFFSFSCSNLQNTEADIQSASDESSLQSEIRNINQRIADNPENNDLKTEKAQLLYRYSQTIADPGKRNPVYSNLRDVADSFVLNTGSIPDPLHDVLVKSWRSEQSSGVKLLQTEPSERTEKEAESIISHFENAITVLPDSMRTYNLLATTHYQHGKVTQAIETLETADERSNSDQADIQEKLAYLYLESGDLQEAQRRYGKLVEDHPGNLIYKHGLVNSLILAKEHEKATEILEQLSEEYPTRYAYQESLATQFYYLLKNRTSEYLNDGDSAAEFSESDFEEISNLLNTSHTIFESLKETLPTSEENLFRIAAFYKNVSLKLKELSSNIDEFSFTELQQEFMEHSLPHWERLVELNSDNMGYISNLHQVYLELEMDEDAATLERSYNF